MEELHTEAPYPAQKKNPVSVALSMHWNMLKKNAILSVVLAVLCVFVLFNFKNEGHLVYGIGYLAAMWVCAFIVDIWMQVMAPLCGSARIIPLGLMWSYMIQRTRSIMPSILVHATNLWGLQNR